MSTRLKLGATLSTAELVLVVKSLMEKVDELEKKLELFSNKDIQTKVETNEQISEDRRGTDKDTRKDVSSFSIRSIFK